MSEYFLWYGFGLSVIMHIACWWKLSDVELHDSAETFVTFMLLLLLSGVSTAAFGYLIFS
jgi:hypothetical protein